MRRLLALLPLLACLLGSAHADGREQIPSNLRLVYTTELRGNLVPCSCPAAPLGGLARRIGWIDSLRAATTDPLLVVDAGTMLPRQETYPRLPVDEFEALEGLHLEAARAAGYDVLVRDREPIGRSGERLPWLRANEAVRIDRDGWTIGVLASQEHVDAAGGRAAVERLGSIDLLVLLCSGDLSFAKKVAFDVGADVAVVSRGACFHEPVSDQGVLFLGAGVDGRYVGTALLALEPDRPPRILEERLRPMDATVEVERSWRDRVEQQVLSLERQFPGALAIGE